MPMPMLLPDFERITLKYSPMSWHIGDGVTSMTATLRYPNALISIELDPDFRGGMQVVSITSHVPRPIPCSSCGTSITLDPLSTRPITSRPLSCGPCSDAGHEAMRLFA